MATPEGFAELAEQMDAAITDDDDAAIMAVARRMDAQGYGPDRERIFRELLAFRDQQDRSAAH